MIAAVCDLQDAAFLEFKVDDYEATASKIPPEVQARMKYSHRENEQIGWDDLRYLRITYLDFDGNIHLGEMVIHKRLALDVMMIFQRIFVGKFPIYQMVLIDDFGYEGITLEELDKRSMEANNTSAYCFRAMTGSSTLLSSHAGSAVDVNPGQNPYIKGKKVLPERGKAYLERDKPAPGLITRDGVVYQAFKEFGWKWGGDWFSFENLGWKWADEWCTLTMKDFQHFEKAQ